ncbi:AraC family transcriptional regulator [Robbsia andropogonis]|uniref:AraC family transcriptional regulator n=1 Tax=Robbsia andropogonis TaxID=28092 RepID=A0A0F5K0I4_9BURK|nr:anthranilate 1,2-dioxygenase regulatory protein AndR [Robbsia andropogonis]KKB63588.1 AraC family transcriptional regulator [Robbsia andropogonis]MCP1116895.1 AraC family transcriptional regulator [Robbsia andropogonis]MCP1126426.1 AraC family transcriptional regulator [Robbsia andropogonis]
MPLSFFHPDALRKYRLFESSDLDETRESISRVMQPHALRPTGHAEGTSHMDFVKVGRLGLGTIAFGSDMHVDVESVDGYYLLMFCLSGQALARTRDTTLRVDQDNGILCRPGHSFDAQLSDNCEQFVLRIDAQAFVSVLGDEPLHIAPRLPVGGPHLRGWMEQLRALTGSTALLESARNSPGIATHMEHLLLELLSQAVGPLSPYDGISGVSAALPSRSTGIAPAFVRRAEDFIRARSADALQLQDIADAAGVPPRTLREGFQHFRGITPMQFVRDIRMSRARETLLRAEQDVRVSDIALECGFFHLGRFSLAYAKTFGESPSETLRRR